MISLYNVCSILCYFIKVGIFFNQTFELQSSRACVGAGELHYKQQTLLTSKDDLNDINDGLYYYEGPEKPANSSQVNSILTQISHCKRKDIIQIEICIQNSVIRYRTYSISTSVWTEWKMFR